MQPHLEPHEQFSASAESELIILPAGATADAVVVAVAGEFSACDVWFTGPDAWLGVAENVTVSIYGRRAGGRMLLAQTLLRNAQHSEDGNGTTAAWVFSIRGAPFEGFEVMCSRSGGATALSSGQFTLRAAAQADTTAVAGSGGLSAPRPVSVTGQVTVTQTQASSLQATVSQSSASALQATVSQSTASSLQTTATQGSPGTHANRWPVILSDGSAQVGTTSTPLISNHVRGSATTFAASTGSITGTVFGSGITAGVKSVAYLWHPSTNARRVEIRRITVSFGGGTGSGQVLLRALRITGVNSSPGGSSVTPTALEGSDSTTLTLQAGATGAPTRASGADYFSILVCGTQSDTYEWVLAPYGKPIVLRTSTAEGIEVVSDVRAAPTAEIKVTVGFEWVEI